MLSDQNKRQPLYPSDSGEDLLVTHEGMIVATTTTKPTFEEEAWSTRRDYWSTSSCFHLLHAANSSLAYRGSGGQR